MHPVSPKPRRKGALAASVLLLLSACVKSEEITLPTIDASEIVAADALVVHAKYGRGGVDLGGILSGPAEGAGHAVGTYFENPPPGDGGALLWGLMLPLAVPLYAAAGAAAAHSPEEIEASYRAFEEVRQDRELHRSLGRKVIEAIDDKYLENWSCVVSQADGRSSVCADRAAVATLELTPVFTFSGTGKYDPSIRLTSSVKARAKVANDRTGEKSKPVLAAKWIYRETIGSFFEFTQNNAESLRRKLDNILGKFAVRIAHDIFLMPRSAIVTEKTESDGHAYLEIPDRVVVRVEQRHDFDAPARMVTICQPVGDDWSCRPAEKSPDSSGASPL